MSAKDILELDLKKHPIIVIDESLDHIKKPNFSQAKIDGFENAVKNTNLLEVVEKIQKEKITKP
jgi:oligoribonuclease NrnB/cAMP/cGMP phosphodiesterase (DHH superfamily)